MASAQKSGKPAAGLDPSVLGKTFSANKAVGAGVQDCPAKATKPCDCQKLIVKDFVTGRKVQTTKVLAGAGGPPETAAETLEETLARLGAEPPRESPSSTRIAAAGGGAPASAPPPLRDRCQKARPMTARTARPQAAS